MVNKNGSDAEKSDKWFGHLLALKTKPCKTQIWAFYRAFYLSACVYTFETKNALRTKFEQPVTHVWKVSPKRTKIRKRNPAGCRLEWDRRESLASLASCLFAQYDLNAVCASAFVSYDAFQCLTKERAASPRVVHFPFVPNLSDNVCSFIVSVVVLVTSFSVYVSVVDEHSLVSQKQVNLSFLFLFLSYSITEYRVTLDFCVWCWLHYFNNP